MTCLALGMAISAPGPAHADYGYRAIWLVCDSRKDYIEVRPFILWNEELDAYIEKYPAGVAADGTKHTTVFLDNDTSYSRECLTSARRVEVAIGTRDTLTITENDKLVTVKEINYVWFASGQEYRLRSDVSMKWQECSGASEGAFGHPLECGNLTKSRTTNEDDIEASRKRE